ncbi:ATP-binding protein [Streptomyces sp.]|uniref:ATP-binding protein n=1 Tax=Streptomyces sp. TaxID=1931 RepID=UPI002D661356|nr:ATP-binding protein [Streptomyces sp.]HZF88335.1 ATP-binding protein [Streptomyces sp.]
MTAQARPGDRPAVRPLFLIALTAAAVSALAVGWAVSVAPPATRGPLGWGAGGGAALLCAAVTVAAHGLRTARATRARLHSARAEAARLAGEREALTAQWRQEHQRLTDAAAHERARLLDEFARERDRLAQEHTAERARLEQEVRRLSTQAERAAAERAAAIAATANAAARMQALATGTLADLRAMEERHSDEDVLADLLHLDHRTAQAGRLADSIAVLTGARSGRRWARPIPMESILRGAMGRISGYQRVRLHAASSTAVAGHAAEGVMHALAELLDNAANFSPPSAEVHVYVEEVPAGVIVSVEDSGLVMSDLQLRRAERAVSGDVTELGGLTGTRLGLAVVGRLARKHGLKVSFRPSARGGTGVLVLLPQDILTEAPAAPRPSGEARPRPVPAPRPAEAAPVHEQGEREPAAHASGGLPKRRRGRTLAAAERVRTTSRADAPRPDEAAGDLKARATRFGDFRRAVRAVESSSETTGGHALPVRPGTGTTGGHARPASRDAETTGGHALPVRPGAETPGGHALSAPGDAETPGGHARPEPPGADTTGGHVPPVGAGAGSSGRHSLPAPLDDPAARTRSPETSPDVPTPSHPEGDTTS